MKKIILKSLSLIIVLCSLLQIMVLNSTAEKQAYCSQIGFDVDTDSFVSFQYNLEKAYYEYYDGKLVGTTTVDSITSHLKEYSLGKKMDLTCTRILTEPSTITVNKKFLCFRWTEKKKFGISELEVYHYHWGWDTVTTHYATSADTATATIKSGISGSGSFDYEKFGFGIDYSSISTITQGICDCTNKTKRNLTWLVFNFGKPQTNEQEERVYEQTYFYIQESILKTSDGDRQETIEITPTYACGNMSAGSSHFHYAIYTSIDDTTDGSLR